MTAFLVLYDYGMGGLWAIAEARSEADLRDCLPELDVVGRRPQWMDDQRFSRLMEERFTVADPTTYPDWLTQLITKRSSGVT
jgi:hypothetical protein